MPKNAPKKTPLQALAPESSRTSEKRRWKETTLKTSLEKMPESRREFTTISGRPVGRLYTSADIEDIDALEDIGLPGEYPYTRGIHPTMYRSRPWTIRQFSGFATAKETNARFKYLLTHGQTGLSTAFDLPTLMGRDSDDPLAFGEVGKCGVAVASLEDMEVLFDGIPLNKVSTSMTINSPALALMAMYFVVGAKQGHPLSSLSGTCQNDILKEYIAQKEYLYPPEPSMRLVVDSIAFCAKHVPKYNPVSISGYHIREAGSTAAQELAFTLRDGIEYVEWCMRAGMDVDEFAPRLSFFFNSHSDFFEEIAKFRAARRIWARVMKERFKARNERSWWLRFHTQTAGCSLTAQQPYNNVVRTALQALAGVLGGTQSLHTNALDETLALPTEEAARIAVRTQQIIMHESGVANAVDPLGGSYFIERLTKDIEEEAWEYIRRIDEMGGMVAAIEAGYPQREIMNASYRYQKELETKDKIMVGVNDFVMENEKPIEILKIGMEAEEGQKARLAALKKRRGNGALQKALGHLKKAAEGKENTMPALMDAVRAYATLGEICETFRQVFGDYEEPKVF
jgi:methylmalonyl-CoA mutase N-terminal domain/subunit